MRETVWRNGSRELNNNREADPVSGPDSRELTPRGGSNFQPRCDECVHKDFSTEDKFQVPAKYAKVLHALFYSCWLLIWLYCEVLLQFICIGYPQPLHATTYAESAWLHGVVPALPSVPQYHRVVLGVEGFHASGWRTHLKQTYQVFMLQVT